MAKSKTAAAAQPQVTMHSTLNIQLKQLVLSASNVRKVYDPKAITDMADDIARRGLLQSLLLRPVGKADDIDLYEVNAGGRRLRGLQLLLKQKRISPDALIPCIIKTEGVAEDDSLTENVMREDLHPLDEFRAFMAMKGQGMSDDDIAASQRVTTAVVKQRLRLASASPKLLEAYTEDKLTLQQLMAFCVVEDHKRQEQVFKVIQKAQPWQRDAQTIKSLLTEKTVRADDERARFVGLDAYQAAGGPILRDLFDEDNAGYLQDPDLLNRMVDEKLEAARQGMLKAGWKWAVAAVTIPYGETNGMQRLTQPHVTLPAKVEKHLAKLQAEQEKLQGDDVPDSPEVQARLAELDAEIHAIENPVPVFAKKDMARAGVFISLDGDGKLDVDYGFIRAEDVRASKTKTVSEDAGAGDDAEDDDGSETGADASGAEVDDEATGKPLSDALLQDLTSFRTVALRNAMSQDFGVAFLSMLHVMCLSHFYHSGSESCLQIRTDTSFPATAPGLDSWPTTKALETRDLELRKLLPENSRDLWAALQALSQADRERLFAHCAATTVNAVRQRFPNRADQVKHADKVAHALGMHMVAAGWTTTADNYLSRVTKPLILAAVEEAKGERTAHLIAHMTKTGMVLEAERLLQGTGWLPLPLRSAESIHAVPAAPEDAAALPAFMVDVGEATKQAA